MIRKEVELIAESLERQRGSILSDNEETDIELNIMNPEKQRISLYRRLYMYQIRALFLKIISQQSKQLGTTLCQILGPLICLLLMYLIRLNLKSLIDTELFDKSPITSLPLIALPHNLPSSLFSPSSLSPYAQSSCLRFFYLAEPSTGFQSQYSSLVSSVGSHLQTSFCKKKNAKMPFFREIEKNSINSQILQNLEKMALEKMEFAEALKGHAELVPDGFLAFKNEDELGAKQNQMKVSRAGVVIGVNDHRVMEYHRNNGFTKVSYKLGDMLGKIKKRVLLQKFDELHEKSMTIPTLAITDGFLSLMDLVSKNFIHHVNERIYLIASATDISTEKNSEFFLNAVISILGFAIYPMSLGLGLPVFMYNIVLEKEKNLKSIMKMHGLKDLHYWCVDWFFNIVFYSVGAALFIYTARNIFLLEVFKETSLDILIHTLFAWGANQVGIAIILQNFISKSRTSTILGYIIALTTLLGCIYTNLMLYLSPRHMPFILAFIPQMTFTRIFYFLSLSCSSSKCYREYSNMDAEATISLYYLYCTAVLYTVLGFLFSYKESKIKFYLGSSSSNKVFDEHDSNEIDQSGVCNEREKVFKLRDVASYPLIIKNISKIYTQSGSGKKVYALKPTNFVIDKGEVFGLLGPNGAGKTTLISILTGMQTPTTGEAWIGGDSMITELPNVYKHIGVCPQFDLLWEELTIEEHLLFYLRLKGYPTSLERLKVLEASKAVMLEADMHKQVSQLSGGMKRRLSLAIALVGEPQALFLDEPTTGLDPKNRKKFWSIIKSVKHDKAIMLTTHIMEEAEALSDRIAIINKGVMSCIGTLSSLRNEFGKGYIFSGIFFKNNSSSVDKYIEDNILAIKKMFEEGKELEIIYEWELLESFRYIFSFRVDMTEKKIYSLSEIIDASKSTTNISHWKLSQTTLGDIFEKVISG